MNWACGQTIETYLIEVIDPRGVLSVDIVGDIAIGLPCAELIGRENKSLIKLTDRSLGGSMYSKLCFDSISNPTYILYSGANWVVWNKSLIWS